MLLAASQEKSTYGGLFVSFLGFFFALKASARSCNTMYLQITLEVSSLSFIFSRSSSSYLLGVRRGNDRVNHRTKNQIRWK